MPAINKDEIVGANKKRSDCIRILEAGLDRADPRLFMSAYVRPDAITVPRMPKVRFEEYTAVYTVAFGKAADSMTRAFGSIARHVRGGIVVMPKGSRSIVREKKFRIFNARHPVPDQMSVRAAKEVIKFLQNRRDDELVVFLISGGGSSLLALPDGITLDEKIYLTDLLLKSGASVGEINCVRKHISKIKGGRLIRNHLRCHGVGLVMSDVEGDDVSSVASGTTYADDRTTYKDALDVLGRYGLVRKAGPHVLRVLQAGAQGKQKSAVGGNVDGAYMEDAEISSKKMIGNYVIARNADCLEAMAGAARRLGYSVPEGTPIQVFGDIKKAAETVYGMMPDDPGACLIFGGESTVKVLGDGRGGRNQEMVLRLLKKAQARRDNKKVTMASMGTDGIDGNSIYAGAITENVVVDIDTIKDAIRRSDSAGFFERLCGKDGRGTVLSSCIRTGPTRTNLLDIGLVLT